MISPMFAQLTILVLAGLAGPLLAFGRRGLIPVVIGELIAGFVLGHTGFGVIDSAAQPLPVLSAIGFAMLMFTAGTHVDIGSPAIRQGFARGVLALAIVGGHRRPDRTAPRSRARGRPPGADRRDRHRQLRRDRVSRSSRSEARRPECRVPDRVGRARRLGDRDHHAAHAGQVGEPARGDRWGRGDHRRRRARAAHRQDGCAGTTRPQQIARRIAAARLGMAGSASRLVLLLGLSAIAQETGASTLVAGFLGRHDPGTPARVGPPARCSSRGSRTASSSRSSSSCSARSSTFERCFTSPSRILLALGLAVRRRDHARHRGAHRRPRAVPRHRPRGFGAAGNARGSREPRPDLPAC